MYQCNYLSPIGNIVFEMNEENLIKITLADLVCELWHDYFSEVILQFNQYFAGKRQTFNLNYQIMGTDFQVKVLKTLACVPYGQVVSYQELANMVGTKGIQAVGTCMRKNPLPILIPCHRVIKTNGELGNYVYGSEIKQRLISLEQK